MQNVNWLDGGGLSRQGPRSNFEIGGGGGGAPSVTQYWGGTSHFLLGPEWVRV